MAKTLAYIKRTNGPKSRLSPTLYIPDIQVISYEMDVNVTLRFLAYTSRYFKFVL